MTDTFSTSNSLSHLMWADVQPRYEALQSVHLTEGNVDQWLKDWSQVQDTVAEVYARLQVSTTQNTADADVERRYEEFLETVFPEVQRADQRMKEQLLESGLEPVGFREPLRRMRAEASLFREKNVPLRSFEAQLVPEYGRIVGAQTVVWDGTEIPVAQLQRHSQDTDRSTRERAWRVATERRLEDYAALNDLWRRLLDLRVKLAANAGLPDYRAYRWQELVRLDYAPADCEEFHRGVEEVVVPAVARLRDRRRRDLGLEALRPWDLTVDPHGRPPLKPFDSVALLEDRVQAMFRQVSEKFGEHFDVMRREGLLDLENRRNKAPGGYCTHFALTQRPFIFMNAVGMHQDVQTLLHEGGHAFHSFATRHLPYTEQRQVNMEFNEVASMAMELLAAPYLSSTSGGFYDEPEAARARIQHLEQSLSLWSTIAAVDAFQHWVYLHPDEARRDETCDAVWGELSARFSPGVDWTGLERERRSAWHGVLHIFEVPFYIIEYGLAQLGAVQIMGNARRDERTAVEQYSAALSLGGTVPLAELYDAAGAKLGFDAETMRQAVAIIEREIGVLSAA